MIVYIVESELDELGELSYLSWYALDECYLESASAEALQAAIQVLEFISKKPHSIIVI